MLSYNGHKVPRELADAIAFSFKQSQFWKDLSYVPQLLNLNDSYSFEMKLRCKVFEAVCAEIMSLNTSEGKVVRLMDSIVVEFNYYHKGDNLILESMVQALEHGFVSLALNLEPRFPYVLSYYGRLLFSSSYATMKSDILEVLLGNEGTGRSAHYNSMVTLALQRLHNKVNTDYNTVNVMRMISERCNLAHASSDSCTIRLESVNVLRQNAYHLAFFNLSQIEDKLNSLYRDRLRTTIFVRKRKPTGRAMQTASRSIT